MPESQYVANKIANDDLGVKIQDQHTPPLAGLFAKSVSKLGQETEGET